ncbi:MAG: electron transport complex subunit RsxC [Candidatus Omnitrophota bacterium]
MISVAEHKKPQYRLASEKFFTPRKLYLALSQHTGKPSRPCVKAGDMVPEAAILAERDGLISSHLHAPSSGKVLAIEEWYHPTLKRAPSIILECTPEPKIYTPRNGVEKFNKKELLDIIAASGIVGLGGAAFPTHVKLAPPEAVDTLIINGCECEPYLTTDCRLMVEQLEQICRGAEIISRIIEPKKVIFTLEDNKPEAIKKMQHMLRTRTNALPSAKLVVLRTAYPQGGEKQLIYATLKRKVPPGKLPFNVGCLVQNVATCFALYETIYLNKPLIERLVTFAGDALNTPKNIWIKIGTTLKELFDQKVLFFKEEPQKIICGGPMMGISLNHLDYPILKGAGGFLFLRSTHSDEESACIRCARCVDACPMNLLPLEYAKRVKHDDYTTLEELNIKDCIECGACAHECPAKIPLVQYIKIGKKYASNS